MSLSLKLSSMKKIKSDKTHTTLRTPEGHEVKIAHNALSKGHKKALEKLPMAEGGMVSDDEVMAEKKAVDEYNKVHEDEPKEYPQEVEAKLQKTDVTPKDHMAKGGQIPHDRPVKTVHKSTIGEIKGSPRMMAGGGDIPDDNTISDSSTPAPDQSQSIPIATSPQMQAVQPQPAEAPQEAQQSPSQVPQPGALEGFQQQAAGINAQAQAEAGEANQKAEALRTNIAAQQKIATDFAASHKAVTDELQAIRQDINNTHIDPNHYLGSMDTSGKISTAIGLALGGVGGGGRGNQVLDFVNSQIDRDVAAQKANLGKKESIYSAVLQQSQNEQQATQMSRLILNDMTLNKLQEAEMTAQNPIVKARAQQAIGQLQVQMAPMIQQQALYKLTAGNPDALKNQDPSQLVRFMVPESQQKEVFHEIAQAQNASANRERLMSLFDKANQENTVLGRAGHLGSTPASVLGMSALELPMIHDQEGRVNDYEQKTLQDLHPKPGDLPGKVAEKRKAYEAFILNKSSAPTAKGYGIDLDKFRSTNMTQPQYKIVKGVKYMRGPNGEAIKVQ